MGKKENRARLRGLGEIFGLPEELVLDAATITIVGDRLVRVENHRGILRYTADAVELLTSNGPLLLEGKSLILKSIGEDEIIVQGQLAKLTIGREAE